MMHFYKFAIIFVTVFFNSGDAKLLTGSMQDGHRPSYNKHEDRNKLRSAKNLLGDPSLETFKFIHQGDTGLDQGRFVSQSKLPTTRYVGSLRYYKGAVPERRLFKVKLSDQAPMRRRYRKLKGTLTFPKNISSLAGECQWDLNSKKGKKILFIPKACVKMVVDFDEKKLQDHSVIALLIPKKDKLYRLHKRKITKKFVLISYGKRMETLLWQLAVTKKYARLLVSKRRNERPRSKSKL